VIPADFIAEWRAQTRWPTDEQVEQDLVLSRALVAIFEDPELAGAVALRGGTALHKLHFSPPRRYSDDIDLVQLRPGPFGPTMDRLRARLDTWLGEPKREQGQGVRLIYRFESELPPVVRLRLKIETNTREHFAVLGSPVLRRRRASLEASIQQSERKRDAATGRHPRVPARPKKTKDSSAARGCCARPMRDRRIYEVVCRVQGRDKFRRCGSASEAVETQHQYGILGYLRSQGVV
jgi:hypothetical protein